MARRQDDVPVATLPLAAAAPRPSRKRLRPQLRRRVTYVVQRLAGLPIATRVVLQRGQSPEQIVRAAYARRFWSLRDASEWLELALALTLWPAVVPALAIWATWRNGSIVARRAGRAPHLQLLDQIRLYFAAGALPPWYYIFELYRRPTGSHARSFIYRCESKGGILAILKERRPPTSIVSNKVAFEKTCRRSGVPTIPVLAIARDGEVEWIGSSSDFEADWFVKPINGKGGRGIERWDYAGEGRFRSLAGELIERDQLLQRIAAKSRTIPRFVQPRIQNHPELQELSNGALATIRALTCLDESGEPELLGAVMRMAIGGNHLVDNFHAGGIAAVIDLDTGVLGPASNLGADARLGWLDAHPDSGALIRGRRLPDWDRFGQFVENAHRVFSDRALIGWDVALTASGPVVVEANGVPDLDIMQRIPQCGMMTARLGQLLAHHVAAR